METYRRRVDYGTGGVERNTDELLEGTRRFLDAVRAVTENKGRSE
ncbi:hypothetical protein [Halalkaliarchaeum desulfuricum]|nr:hypothetical protein [Halalkaliarchaeum desulfuricum]